MLRCTFILLHTKPQSARKSFFSVIIVNGLNKDQGLVQIKGLQKVAGR